MLVSAVLSATGSPSRLIRRWLEGDFELVVSSMLLDELRRVLSYPRIAERIPAGDADDLVEVLEAEALMAPDSLPASGIAVADPNDEYLVSLAAGEGVALVSGDKHLLDLSGELPIYSPAEFLRMLDQGLLGS